MPTPPNHIDPLVNAVVLVGITRTDAQNEPVGYEQFYGRIEAVLPAEGIDLRLPDGTLRRLPPQRNALQPAEPGSYTLQSTGEVVTDPDFTALYFVSV